jgi:hypothetical protein
MGHSRPSHPAALAGLCPEFSKTEHNPSINPMTRCADFVAKVENVG